MSELSEIGKECPIYYCCRIQNGFHSCGECDGF